jgi:archaellum component FlaF (FlaF/FlaG flagellin family)
MDKVLITVLLVVASLLASSIVVNTVLPSVQRAGGDVAAVSARVSDRIRSDVRIVETAAVSGGTEVQIWAKNVGAVTIANPDRLDVFFGPVGDFQRIPPCAQTGGEPTCWEAAIENDTKWTPYATARITIRAASPLQAGNDYVVTVVLPTGVIASTVFSL